MKIFQIENGICHWDATKQFSSIEATKTFFPENVVFVEAPDHVFEGWGYINGEFIQPTPPDGWYYDTKTGTFYEETQGPAHAVLSEQEIVAAMTVDHEYRLTLLELGIDTTQI